MAQSQVPLKLRKQMLLMRAAVERIELAQNVLDVRQAATISAIVRNAMPGRSSRSLATRALDLVKRYPFAASACVAGRVALQAAHPGLRDEVGRHREHRVQVVGRVEEDERCTAHHGADAAPDGRTHAPLTHEGPRCGAPHRGRRGGFAADLRSRGQRRRGRLPRLPIVPRSRRRRRCPRQAGLRASSGVCASSITMTGRRTIAAAFPGPSSTLSPTTLGCASAARRWSTRGMRAAASRPGVGDTSARREGAASRSTTSARSGSRWAC